jgi:phage protein D
LYLRHPRNHSPITITITITIAIAIAIAITIFKGNMANATTLYELEQTFYVPTFKVEVERRELPAEVVRDVIEVSYHDNVDEIDSFDMTISNYHSQYHRPKYEPPFNDDYAGIFDPGQEIKLWMGYKGEEQLMLSGEITSLAPSFPSSGGLTLRVSGLNVLHRFRTTQHTYAWDEQRDSDIATEIGRNPVSEDRPGLGFEVRTAPRQDERAETYVFMDNQYDIVFLMQRARRHGYELVLREEDEETGQPAHLYFGPSEAGEIPTYKLEWGRSLISFRPTLSTANQVSEVIVRGWDRRNNEAIEGRASWQDLYPSGSAERSKMDRLAQAFGNRREVVTNRPVHTADEANSLARSLLSDLFKDLVEADGETVGLPDLRAGRTVEIANLGERFSGVYYVLETTHTIGDSGYTTSFRARREEGLA